MVLPKAGQLQYYWVEERTIDCLILFIFKNAKSLPSAIPEMSLAVIRSPQR